MKKFLVPMLFLPTLLLGQEDFSFPIYFEDSAGHRDTVYFGYDSLATDSLDLEFGEVDISQVPWDTTMDVRLAGVRVDQGHDLNLHYPYQTKKLVASPLCDRNASVFTVKILTRHWPVTASWDSTLFQGACLSTTTFSSIISDGIADSRRVTNGVKGGFLGFVRLGGESRITFTEQRGGRYTYIYEVTPDPARIDTVNLFWISLSRAAFDRGLNPIVRPGNKKSHLPMLWVAGDQLIFRDVGARISDVRLYSLTGKELVAPVSGRQVDLSSLKTGVYLLSYASDGEYFRRTVFKQ